ncbi:MAG: DUF1385 domain-containing protein [Clostridiaceae bacterium]
MDKKPSVGGQAVIEGVMMRGKLGTAIAVRKYDGEIEISLDRSDPITKKYNINKIPFLRGVVTLFDSMIVGIKSLNYSASFFEDDEEEPSKFENFLKSVFKDKINEVLIGISLVISMIMSISIFFILPTFVANLLKNIGVANTVMLNLGEGIIRITLFFIYILLVSKMEDIRRVFEYHGAEHKTIFAYEKNEELTPENAKKHSRFHPRCGTNFLFLVMVISIILFSFTGWHSLPQRILSRVLLLPVVAGLTYEIIKWLGKTEGTLGKIISYPGLAFQKLTTREPDEEQLEVAIASLLVAEGIKTPEDFKKKEIEPEEANTVTNEDGFPEMTVIDDKEAEEIEQEETLKVDEEKRTIS